MIFDDEAHSDWEKREIIIGPSAYGRLLVVSFSEEEDAVCLISARRATFRERDDYEKNFRIP